MKWAENIRPIHKNPIKRGDNIPQTGQNVIVLEMNHKPLNADAVGIILGQYISHGMLIFFTIGSQNAKYKKIPITTVMQKIEKYKAHLC